MTNISVKEWGLAGERELGVDHAGKRSSLEPHMQGGEPRRCHKLLPSAAQDYVRKPHPLPVPLTLKGSDNPSLLAIGRQFEDVRTIRPVIHPTIVGRVFWIW
uniref:Uncharacterized protein n=1 Tax=Oryza meridionalis TaxID=40149 RepID=A0A0E0CHB3_9ORYZ